MKRVMALVASYVILLLLNCTLTITVEETTVRAQNDMKDLDVTFSDGTRAFITIDLYNVKIGDVEFSEILAGTTTTKKTTLRRGWVGVSIGSAVIKAKVGILQQSSTVTNLENLMETKIVENEDNLVVFDESTAEDFLSYLESNLGKKVVKIEKKNN